MFAITKNIILIVYLLFVAFQAKSSDDSDSFDWGYVIESTFDCGDDLDGCFKLRIKGLCFWEKIEIIPTPPFVKVSFQITPIVEHNVPMAIINAYTDKSAFKDGRGVQKVTKKLAEGLGGFSYPDGEVNRMQDNQNLQLTMSKNTDVHRHSLFKSNNTDFKNVSVIVNPVCNVLSQTGLFCDSDYPAMTPLYDSQLDGLAWQFNLDLTDISTDNFAKNVLSVAVFVNEYLRGISGLLSPKHIMGTHYFTHNIAPLYARTGSTVWHNRAEDHFAALVTANRATHILTNNSEIFGLPIPSRIGLSLHTSENGERTNCKSTEVFYQGKCWYYPKYTMHNSVEEAGGLQMIFPKSAREDTFTKPFKDKEWGKFNNDFTIDDKDYSVEGDEDTKDKYKGLRSQVTSLAKDKIKEEKTKIVNSIKRKLGIATNSNNDDEIDETNTTASNDETDETKTTDSSSQDSFSKYYSEQERYAWIYWRPKKCCKRPAGYDFIESITF